MIVTTLKFYNMGTLYLCVLCIMVGFGEFLIAFAADFEHTLNVIDADLLQYGISSGPLTDANRMRIKLMFRNLVKFHCDFRQLCDDFIAMIDSVFHILFWHKLFFPTRIFPRLANRCSETYSNILFALFYCASLFWGILLIQLNVVRLSCSILSRLDQSGRIS